MDQYIRSKVIFIFFCFFSFGIQIDNIFSQNDSLKKAVVTQLNPDFKYFDVDEFIKKSLDINCRFYFDSKLKLSCLECDKKEFRIEIYNKRYFFEKMQKLKYMKIELKFEKQKVIMEIKGKKIKNTKVIPVDN